ncbi:hypothetical protein EDB92DRAFT_1820368 [Lactarius akahatsu]|uniref:Uncharacterized protein n=1 Tax=Lactarius akahatsu TaxID=416441 RepID=A0AAD4L5G5_9AGAM|nr:hypothetical protein EDB92DRAFT_1820368 [Lactarius akahatsu]
MSDISGAEGTNAEDIPILLPSTLGAEWCFQHGVQSLALKEAKLQYAQANDSIHRICLALGFKSALFQTQVRVENIDTRAHEHAQNYGMARDAYIKVQQASDGSLELPPLHATDLYVKTAILGDNGTHSFHGSGALVPLIWKVKDGLTNTHAHLVNSQSCALAPCESTT